MGWPGSTAGRPGGSRPAGSGSSRGTPARGRAGLDRALYLPKGWAADAGRRRAALVPGLATAWYDQVSPEQAEDLIRRALANGADGVALQSLPYWWQAEYRQFRRYYLPRSEGWAPLWDYDATLKRLFRTPSPSAHGRGRPGS